MRVLIEKISNSRTMCLIKDIVATPYFIAGFMLYMLICLLSPMVVGLVGVIIAALFVFFSGIFLDDLTSKAMVLPIMVFLYKCGAYAVLVGKAYMIVGLCVISILLFAGFLIFIIRLKTFSLKDGALGVLVFCVALAFNGFFYKGYAAFNLVFGGGTAVVFATSFIAFRSVRCNSDTLQTLAIVAMGVSIMAAVNVLSLVISNARAGTLLVGGTFDRYAITPFWSQPNAMSGIIVSGMPLTLYLATRAKRSYGYCIVAIALFLSTLPLLSRNTFLFGGMTLAAGLALVCFSAEDKKSARIVTGCTVLLFIVGLIVLHRQAAEILGRLDTLLIDPDGGVSDNGRFDIYKQGWQLFKSAPIFGGGFDTKIDIPNNIGSYINLYHNIFVQLLASTGIVGVAAFGFHLVQVFMQYKKSEIKAKAFFALTILMILALSILDNHFFYPQMLLTYSLCVGILREEKIFSKREIAEEN